MKFRNYGLVLMLVVAGACDDESGADGDESEASDDGMPGEIDVDAIMAEAADYASYTKVNAEPRASQHALGDTVNMWVGDANFDMYASIDPATGTADVSFAAGTYLFKEHLAADGGFNGLTIMFKATEGYNAEAEDWWWGRTDADYTVLDKGKVDFCISCHAGAAGSGYVFGVPADNRL